jgi:hypothetical protein
MSTAAIAGIVVGVVAGIINLLGIAFFIRRRWRPKTLKVSDEYHQPGAVKPELDSKALDVAKKDLDSTAHSNGNFYGGNMKRLIPELHATNKIQHNVMGDVRPAAELSGPSAAAELPNDLSGPRAFRTLNGRYELP